MVAVAVGTCFEAKIREIERHQELDQYDAVIGECGVLLEQALRKLMEEILPQVRSAEESQRLHEAQVRIGGGSKTFHDFTMGQLVGLFRDARLFDIVRRVKTSNLRLSGRIPWDQLVEWRNSALHGAASSDDPVWREQAMLTAHYAKLFLHETEMIGDAKSVAPADPERDALGLDACTACKKRLNRRWRFCPWCGTSCYNICDNCSRKLEATWRVCPYCESRVRGSGDTDMERAKHEYRLLCRGAYLDEVVNAREREMLEEKRLELGIAVDEAEEIEMTCVSPAMRDFTRFLEGVYVDRLVNAQEREFLNGKIEGLGIDPAVAEETEREYRRLLGLDPVAAA